nr:MAG TPA: hypothetical protein [Caudoviricetes sp.]
MTAASATWSTGCVKPPSSMPTAAASTTTPPAGLKPQEHNGQRR